MDYPDDAQLERVRPYRPDIVRVDRGDWKRAGGDCICDVCGFVYYDHQVVTGYRWLRKLCNGELVKL